MRGIRLGDGIAPLLPLQIDVRPLSTAKLAWAHEYQRRKAERAPHRERALVAIHRPQYPGNLLWVGLRREVLTLRWRQGTANITRRITQGASGGNRVAENLKEVAPGAM